ncbi:MAG: aminodeoxychorismate synthase component I, partial [Actinobacteria bacterium]|nr:aminodeoxychorismate synthase component I [Actinomycetota bacterium]
PDFTGGFIGYFSYELKNYMEKLPQSARDDLKVPVFYLIYYSELLAYSHDESRWFLINNFEAEDESSSLSENIISHMDNKRLEIEKLLSFLKQEGKTNEKNKTINELIAAKYGSKNSKALNLISNIKKPDYLKAVLKAKRYIHDGDIYQMNMTQRFECSLEVEPYDLYYILRQKNAAPFSAYLSFPELKIGTSPPERFLFLKNEIIETRPIKGTRPRGRNTEQDLMYAAELKESIKDRAELNMIVDLERNDLGKFCRYGTVKVKEHAVVEKYAKVFHLVSTVTGKVQKGYDIADILKAVFPGGSITGAPKIRAMEIIDELEPTTRGIYTGAIGYIGNDMTMDLNIAIRTFIIKGSKFYYNVGGGIVEDSNPESEYLETLDKGLALKETLEYFSYKNLCK